MIKEIKEDTVVIYNSLLEEITVKNDLEHNPFGHYLVYLNSDNEIVGFLYYSDIYDRAEINQIEVDFFHRNCGIASKLLEKMFSSVQKNITLEVKKDNIPAISLYKKYDFEEIGIRKGYYRGIDGILMEKKKK